MTEKLIGRLEIPGDGVQAPGAIVLYDLGDQYVTWFHNTQDGGRHAGQYFLKHHDDALARAYKNFMERCARYAAHVTHIPA